MAPLKKPHDAPVQILVYFAFPDDENTPAKATECCSRGDVAAHVRCELPFPVLCPRLRHSRIGTARVPVPEASVDLEGCLEPREDHVRGAREIAAVQPESVAQPVRRAAHRHLRCRIVAADGRHDAASGFF